MLLHFAMITILQDHYCCIIFYSSTINSILPSYPVITILLWNSVKFMIHKNAIEQTKLFLEDSGLYASCFFYATELFSHVLLNIQYGWELSINAEQTCLLVHLQQSIFLFESSFACDTFIRFFFSFICKRC